ncbi:unnamed protein product, partial [Didymodactylos carnosus]
MELGLSDAYSCAHQDDDFETVYRSILMHPEWITKIPDGRKWAILHQIVYHGNVDQLNRLLSLQTQNTSFRLLSKTSDDKTVLDIARDLMTDNPEMLQQIERLLNIDDLLNNAKKGRWNTCKDILLKMPEIINEKTPYRHFYFIHQIAYVGDKNMFDEFNQQFHFDLNVLTNDRKS